MDNPARRDSAWWMFALAAAAIAFGASILPRADEWWEFATIAVMAVAATTLVIAGVRALRTHRTHDG